MQRCTDSTVIVIGAGPKALALATKRAVLKKLGCPVPKLVVVDRRGVAAAWSGESGLTDGSPLLGTPPEKDVGFPYRSTGWGDLNAKVDEEMMAYSWHRYLMSTGRYADWVDRGRPEPTHRIWAGYLRWVGQRVELELVVDEIREICIRDDRWLVSCGRHEDGSRHEITGEGLVITGTGAPVRIPGQPRQHRRVMDGNTFWTRVKQFSHLHRPVSTAVVGTGETAAAIVVALIEALHSRSSIEIISSSGVPYSRGESFEESRLFSSPGSEWEHLTEHHRREFMQRTDRGVFSLRAQQIIDRADNVRSLAGQVTKIGASDEHVVVKVRYGDEVELAAYDYVIVAIGFDPLSFGGLFDEHARQGMQAAVGRWDKQSVERAIGPDLGIHGFRPRLHLPMLAGVAQGPGFPNLSCLGLGSDRILASYVSAPCRSPNGRAGVLVAGERQRAHEF
jgi:mycobactin lysine-N-oxygenase